jgi:hypothetical protein
VTSALKQNSIYNYNSNPNNSIFNSPSHSLMALKRDSLHNSQYAAKGHQNQESKKSIKQKISSSMNLHRNKSSQKSLNSRKSLFVNKEDSFAAQMMRKRQEIIEKKINLNKRLDCIGQRKQSLFGLSKKSQAEKTSLYPSVQNNKYPNPVLKRKAKKLNETSLMNNSIFYQNEMFLNNKEKKIEGASSAIQSRYLLAQNLSDNYLLKNSNDPKIKSRQKLIKDYSQEQIKIRSQDKYTIQKGKFIERSKKLNNSLQNFQSKSHQKKVIFLTMSLNNQTNYSQFMNKKRAELEKENRSPFFIKAKKNFVHQLKQNKSSK